MQLATKLEALAFVILFNMCSRWIFYGFIDSFLWKTFHTVVTGIRSSRDALCIDLLSTLSSLAFGAHGMLYALISSGSFRMSLRLTGRFLHSHQDGHSSSAGTSNPWLQICYANLKLPSFLVPLYHRQSGISVEYL
jgi:hypothetical protein